MFLVSFSVLHVVELHLGLIPSTLGLKTIREALTANLSRTMIRTRRVPQKGSYLEL
jgi:hypothetical protein